jgi:hypothetical protein
LTTNNYFLYDLDDLDKHKSNHKSKNSKETKSKQKSKKGPERFGAVPNISGADSQPKVN